MGPGRPGRVRRGWGDHNPLARVTPEEGSTSLLSPMDSKRPTETAGATRTLSELDSMEWVERYGIPLPRRHPVSDADAAVAAAESLGFPVVVKLCGQSIAHKSERHLVCLGLDGPDAVRTAAAQLLARARPEDGEVDLLVAEIAGSVASEEGAYATIRDAQARFLKAARVVFRAAIVGEIGIDQAEPRLVHVC